MITRGSQRAKNKDKQIKAKMSKNERRPVARLESVVASCITGLVFIHEVSERAL